MKLVEGHRRIRQVLGGALDEGRAHVDADLGDGTGIAAMCGEIIGKGRDGHGLLALGREHHTRLVDIDKQRDVVMAAPGGGLVNRHPRDSRQVGVRPGTLHIMVDDAP